MVVTEKSVKDLKSYKNNPRNNDDAVAYVANSIKEFGFKVPIVIDKNNVVVAGHTRLKACKKLGIKTVPCIVADDLTDEQIKAFRLADNKVGERSVWDDELLGAELDGIDFDMSEFGFDLELGADDDGGTDIVEDEAPEPPTEPVAKKGNLWQLGEHRLICGDSTDIAVIARLMGEDVPDMVLTDPPYGVSIQHEDGRVGSEKKANSKGKRVTGANIYHAFQNDDTTETAENAYNVLSKLCDKIVLWGGNYFLDFLPPSDSWLVWDKREQDDMRNNFADGEMAWCSFHTVVRIYHQMWNGMIRKGEHEKRVHPTQKPVQLLREILNDFTEEHEKIVDVFGGSGSTLIACEQSSRKCYMCEIDEYYCDVIIQRWETLTGQKAKLIEE